MGTDKGDMMGKTFEEKMAKYRKERKLDVISFALGTENGIRLATPPKEIMEAHETIAYRKGYQEGLEEATKIAELYEV